MDERLAERDRLMIAVTLRAIVARDIDRRGIAETYHPAAITVSGYDLIEFANEMLSCCDGDNVDLAAGVADAVADAMDEHGLGLDERAQDIEILLTPLPVLAKLDDANPIEIDAQRADWADLS